MSRTSFETLLEAGCHFGHLKRKWNPAMAPYIFKEMNGIHIIDLHKTVGMVETAAEAMKQIAKSGKKGMLDCCDNLKVCDCRELNRSIFTAGSFHSDSACCYDGISANDIQVNSTACSHSEESICTAADKLLYGDCSRRSTDSG